MEGKQSKFQKKNPVMELHEKFRTIEYEFVQEGAGHEPIFKVRALVHGKPYEGVGASKQAAKVNLAIQALEELPNITAVKNEPAVQPKLEGSQALEKVSSSPFAENSPYLDFTTGTMPGRDRPLYAPPRFRNPPQHQWIQEPSKNPISNAPAQLQKQSPHIMGPLLPPQAVQQGFSQLFTNRPQINAEKARSYPVMVLCEIFPDMQISWCEGVGRGDRQFKVEAEVQGRRFFGEGRSKKMAKLNLAKTILLCMYDIHDFKDAEISTKPPKAKTEETQMEKKFPLTQLKELVGEELSIEVVQQESIETDEKLFHATVVVKGVAYEAIGKNRNLARLRAAKKALDVIRPRKEGVVKTENGENGDPVKEIDVTRHPTMVFYELYRDVKFIESETKLPSGLTEYIMEAEVEGKTFQGRASSKKKAKLRLVLQAFDEVKEVPPEDWTSVDVKDVLEDKQLSSNPAANHPIVLLLKLNPQTRFDVDEDYSCEVLSKYKATAHVGERDFNGEGPNKKTAKTMAAREALHSLYGIDPDTYVEENRTDYFEDDEPKHEVPAELCNMVAEAVQTQFLSVFQGETQCKVVAAFVLAKFSGINPNPSLKVISIGTGTKCITGDQIDHKGQTLNDSHGEIIACRGFRQFLFDQLLLVLQNDSNTILQRLPNGKFALQSDLKVYLYVNTAPCGDGRVFTLQTQQQGAKNKTAGLLRTKIENGQGTIPVPENSIQTSDGLLEGERLRTMSCSDKILKWNALGVQGALLSYFMEPVYIEGIVIGLHYHYSALYRALYKRAGKMAGFPQPYLLKKPALGTPSKSEIIRDTSKATSNSFNWYFNQRNVEAVNATTGKTVVLAPSRLCKLNFFDKFMQAAKLCSLKMEGKTYHDAKMLAGDHQKAKDCFFKALNETTCGRWIGKPYEHDMFGY